MRTQHNRIRLIRGNTGIVSKWNSDSVSLEWKIIKFMARISSVSSLSSTDFFFKVWYLQLLASARKRLSALAYIYSFICSLVFGEGNGNPLQYSCLKNPMERGAWWATVQKVAELDMTEWPSTYISFIHLFVIYKGVLFAGVEIKWWVKIRWAFHF